MCRILFKKDNSLKFNENELRVTNLNNPDGCGLYYYDEDAKKAVIQKWEKGTDFDKVIYPFIKEAEKLPHLKNFAIHFRIGTSGGKTIEQVHPQIIDKEKGLVMFHNGIVREFEIKDKWSDTQTIARCFKDWGFDVNSFKNNPLTKTAWEKIFDHNKILLIDKDDYVFLNENLGEWEDGIWKSNHMPKYLYDEKAKAEYEKEHSYGRQGTLFDMDEYTCDPRKENYNITPYVPSYKDENVAFDVEEKTPELLAASLTPKQAKLLKETTESVNKCITNIEKEFNKLSDIYNNLINEDDELTQTIIGCTTLSGESSVADAIQNIGIIWDENVEEVNENYAILSDFNDCVQEIQENAKKLNSPTSKKSKGGR